MSGSSTRYYIPGLDGLRALAIGLVLFSHSVIFGPLSSVQPIALEAGYAGVAIFFVLSGYLITNLLVREEEVRRRISFGRFYLRRSLRLLPALWLYLLLVWLIWLPGYLPDNPWHSFVTSLLYVRNAVGRGHETDHLWSLSIEEQFYVIWPLLMVALPRRNGWRLAVALSAVATITAWRCYAAAQGLASPGTLYMRSDFAFDAPLIGCALALTEHVAPKSVWWKSTAARTALLTTAGLIGLATWLLFRLDVLIQPGLKSTVLGALGIVLISSQTGRQGAVSSLMAWKPLVLIGQISYGIYLWQQFFLGPPQAGFTTLRMFPIGLLATLGVASLSYVFLERPLLRLKDQKLTTVAAGVAL